MYAKTKIINDAVMALTSRRVHCREIAQPVFFAIDERRRVTVGVERKV